MLRLSQRKTRKERITNVTIRGIAKVTQAYQIGPDTKTIIMAWACDAKGGDPHNKKRDGNKTQGTYKDKMA